MQMNKVAKTVKIAKSADLIASAIVTDGSPNPSSAHMKGRTSSSGSLAKSGISGFLNKTMFS